jgi:hypothetical protein
VGTKLGTVKWGEGAPYSETAFDGHSGNKLMTILRRPNTAKREVILPTALPFSVCVSAV